MQNRIIRKRIENLNKQISIKKGYDLYFVNSDLTFTINWDTQKKVSYLYDINIYESSTNQFCEINWKITKDTYEKNFQLIIQQIFSINNFDKFSKVYYEDDKYKNNLLLDNAGNIKSIIKTNQYQFQNNGIYLSCEKSKDKKHIVY